MTKAGGKKETKRCRIRRRVKCKVREGVHTQEEGRQRKETGYFLKLKKSLFIMLDCEKTPKWNMRCCSFSMEVASLGSGGG